MNGQRYQKKEEESVVPSANAVVHLVPNMKRKKMAKEKNPTNYSIDQTNKQKRTDIC